MDSPLIGNARPEKALWYQEVLSLDPDSRIFLPYARLLAELGRGSEAVDVLKAGLARHPEFLEARLFLIDLLYAAGQEAAAGFEADSIIDLLSRSPALWRIWSRRPGLRADQAAMMLFFAAAMQKGGISLADVFEAGMASLEGKAAPCQDTEDAAPPCPMPVPAPEVSVPVPAPIPTAAPAETPTSAPDKEASAPSAAPAPSFVMPDDAQWYSLDAVPEDDDIYDDDDPAVSSPASSLALAASLAAQLPVQEELPAAPEQFADEGPALPDQTEIEHIPAMSPVPRGMLEGKSSLCTRSMARVLEEQGATEEAADIYRELLENCATDEERDELNTKLASLLQGTDSALPAQQASSGILDMLETLADRLEKRSRV